MANPGNWMVCFTNALERALVDDDPCVGITQEMAGVRRMMIQRLLIPDSWIEQIKKQIGDPSEDKMIKDDV
jgi:hypothetical protein